ncbi:MAG: hypothetical protein RMI30_07035, partial [Thermodesulfovibrio sp.]|nr:hypothetical protein [Thermodesulfovibrio sp.]
FRFSKEIEEVKLEIAKVRADVEKVRADLTREIYQLKASLIKGLFIFWIGQLFEFNCKSALFLQCPPLFLGINLNN